MYIYIRPQVFMSPGGFEVHEFIVRTCNDKWITTISCIDKYLVTNYLSQVNR